MSLINQMLQDLDARGTHASSAGVMQGQIRVVPERSGLRIVAALGIVLLVLAMLAAGYWWWQGRTMASPVAALPASPPPIAVPQAAKSEIRLPDFSLKMAADLSQVPLPEVQDLPPVQPPLPSSAPTATASPGAPANANAPAPAPVAKTLPVAMAHGTAADKSLALLAKERPTESAAPIVLDKQIKELTPQQSAENAYRNGATLIQQGRSQEAIAALEQALQFDPGHAAARQTLVAVLLEYKRKDDALRRLREGLQLDPAQTGLAMILAHLQVDRGETASAIETLQKSLAYAGERADYPAFLAALLQREARHKEAIEQYNAALRRAPQNGVWWMGLGISLQAEHRSTEAVEAFTRAKSAGTLSPDLRAFVEEKLANLQR